MADRLRQSYNMIRKYIMSLLQFRTPSIGFGGGVNCQKTISGAPHQKARSVQKNCNTNQHTTGKVDFPCMEGYIENIFIFAFTKCSPSQL